jgi:hypothetical protein
MPELQGETMTPREIIARQTRVMIGWPVDDAGDTRRVGQRGKIVGADTYHIGTPDDPYWDVEFMQPYQGAARRDRFWSEELKLVPEDVEANQIADKVSR